MITATRQGEAGNGHTPTATYIVAAHAHLDALLARDAALPDDIARAAIAVVQTWMLDKKRAVLSVDVSRQVPDTTRDVHESLNTAVRHLPDAVFRWGLDIRGQHTVRLSGLNELLGRDRDDRTLDTSHTTSEGELP